MNVTKRVFFKWGLWRTFLYTRWPQFEEERQLRKEAVLPYKVFAQQHFQAIAESGTDPFHYGLLDLWLEVYQEPWNQPRNLHKLIDDLAEKIASRELLVYLEDSLMWRHVSSIGASGARTSGFVEADGTDEVRSRSEGAAKAPVPPRAAPASSDSVSAGSMTPEFQAGEENPKQPEHIADTAANDTPQNPELEARAQELENIGGKLRTEGFVPKSDADIQHAIATGNLGNRRFLVSIQKTRKRDETIGFRRPDTGRTTMWTSTYDMLKDGDLSAPLLSAMIGNTYDPDAEYTMYILDQGEDYEQDGALTFSPTWDNMKKFGPEELHMDNPEDPIHDKELLASVMNPETQEKYADTMQEFWKEAEGTDKSEYVQDDINEFLGEKGFDLEERKEFRARHLYRTQIGANTLFLGTGATKFTLDEKNRNAIEKDGIRIKGKPENLGAPEMLTIEKDPPTIAKLEKKGVLKSIPLNRT